MLDVYTNLSGKQRAFSGVFDKDNPRKILFKSKNIGECYKWILDKEPENNSIKRRYEIWNS